MQGIVTVQQLTEKFELLDPTQKQIVDELVTFLLSRRRALSTSEAQRILLQTSIWTEEDIQQIMDVQQEMKAWQAPVSS